MNLREFRRAGHTPSLLCAFLYFDTSFLVPLVVREASSNDIERFVKSLPAEAITISQWTCVEFSSLLARDVRMRVLSGAEALEVSVQGGTVTLRGLVRSGAERSGAERLARSVAGVADVNNLLKVK